MNGEEDVFRSRLKCDSSRSKMNHDCHNCHCDLKTLVKISCRCQSVVKMTSKYQVTSPCRCRSLRWLVNTRSDNNMMSLVTVVICLLISASAIQATNGESAVIGVVGGKVSLPCNVTPPTPDDQVSLVLWYKEESTTPIYSLDARKGTLDQARHASADSLTARSYFSTINKAAHLIIEQLLESDAGIYRCRADFRKARTRNFAINLSIVTPPEKPVIKDGNTEETLPSLIGPFNEGDRLFLVCESFGGKPRPSLTWWRESVLLDESYEYISPNTKRNPISDDEQVIIRNELEIKSLARHDLMAVLTCSAINNNISSPLTTSVTIDLNFRPVGIEITDETKNKPMSADKPVEVTCKSSGSRPPAIMTWWKGSKQLKKSRETISVDGNVTTSVLTFVPTSDDSGKFISCRAENPLISGSAIEDGFKLDIHYIPQLSLRLGSKLRHSHIQEGNDVYFECNIRAMPWATDIRWWFEGKEVHTNTSSGIIVSNQSLVLQRVTKASRGRYTCSASNSEGEGESNSVHLRVQYAPVCKNSQKILYGAAKFEAIKVNCEVDADPPDSSFRWAFNTSANPGVDNSGTKVISHVPVTVPNLETEESNLAKESSTSSHSISSMATYIPESESDYGTLYCWARNSVGGQVDPCVFSIVPAGPPDPVRNCTIGNGTEDTIKVTCDEGYDGGLLQHFVAEVRDSEFQRLHGNVTTSWPTFTIGHLPSGTSFLVVIYSANSKGRSKPIVLTTATSSLPESLNRLAKGNVWQLNFSPILALLIAIVVVLVMIAFIIVIIIKTRGSNSSASNSSSSSSHSSNSVNNRNRKGSKGAKSVNGSGAIGLEDQNGQLDLEDNCGDGNGVHQCLMQEWPIADCNTTPDLVSSGAPCCSCLDAKLDTQVRVNEHHVLILAAPEYLSFV